MTRHSPVRAAALSLLLATGGCSHFAFQDPGIVRPGLNVAEAALRSGSGQIALQVSDNVLRETPDNVAALEIKADALTLLGSLDESAAIFEALLAKHPDSTRATIGLGRIKLTKDPAAAEALFQRVLKRDANDLTALNNLGIARDLQGRHPEAQAVYRQALAIDPALTSAQVNMALSLAMSGRGAEAIQLLKPAATLPNASVKVKHDYAVVLAMAGQRAEAERVLAENLPPEEVRQVLDSVTGTHTARGLAPDRGELNRATTQASRNRGDPVPADVVQPIPARAMRAPPSAPPPEVVRPMAAEAQERGTAETGTQVPQPVDPAAAAAAAAAANQRPLSAPMRAVDVPVAAAAVAPMAVPVAPAASADGVASAASADGVAPAASADGVAPAASADGVASAASAAGVASAASAAGVASAASAAGVAARTVERPAGGMAVQFAAAPSEEAAQAFWRDLVRRFPDILGRHEPLVIRFQQNGTVFWRLRTDGFQSVEDAQSLCAQVRASGQNCFVVRS